jgi:outer membrane PBP1 activator LpoA protein
LFAAVAAIAVAALCKAADDPASAAPAAARDAAQALATKPVFALLLPLDATEFAPPAEAVLAGCKAALSIVPGTPTIEVMRTDASGDRIVSGYEAASARGAAVIVGPMTRGGVTALATSGRVRSLTLALNVPEQPLAMPEHLYVFGLSNDAEARQVARSARAEGLRDAVVVQSPLALSRRASQAFAQEWFALGGTISDVLDFSPQADLARMRQRLSRSGADLIFLAADPDQARAVRPYLNNQIPVFATSQINSGRIDPVNNVDLNGIRFVEMPWLAQPDNMTAMIYPRPESLTPDLQRFYALGIDACRIANELLNRRPRVNLEGVTGTLTLRPTGYIEREAMPSVFRDGSGVAFEGR